MRRFLIAAAVLAALVLGGAALGHLRSDDGSSMVPSTTSAAAADLGSPPPGSAVAATAADSGSAPAGVTPEASGSAVAQLDDASLNAARAAGVVAVSRTREVFEAGAISRHDLTAEFATERFAPELAQRTSTQAVDLLFGLRRQVGRHVDVHLVSQPVTATAAAVGPARVTVSVWTVTVIVAEGASPVPEIWSKVLLDMADVDGRWLVDGWQSAPGPTPASAPEGVFATDDEVLTVLAWPPAGVSDGDR